jgi:hypothetical protein
MYGIRVLLHVGESSCLVKEAVNCNKHVGKSFLFMQELLQVVAKKLIGQK